jgi:two-component system CheB/CheR fusion protein
MAKKGTGKKPPAASRTARLTGAMPVPGAPPNAARPAAAPPNAAQPDGMPPGAVLAGAVLSGAAATNADFTIVGIGASAGGLEALERFFGALPSGCGMAFVVIQHLDPTHPSAMAALLQRHAALPVTEASDQEVERDHVYVMPPGKGMTLEGRRLRLKERAEQPELALIDAFFRSLAAELKERAVGIILSGTGRDGTLGAKAIKAEMGMVMVQDPETARYDGMPRAAIGSGVADYVVAPQEMPAPLIDYVGQSHGRMCREDAEERAADMATILSLIRLRTRRDFSGYKPSTLKRRVERRMGVNHVETLSEYAQFLDDNPPETEALFKDLLINVTQFFRDEPAFDSLRTLLVGLLSAKRDGDTVRAWTAGCSTGEESYSLAILLHEVAEELGKSLVVQVFGTDIDPEAIVTARAGIYPAATAQDLSEERLRRFFVRTDSQLQIKKEVREKLVFAVQDITNDPPFSRMDLISLRNVLIYLGADLQRRLIPVLHYSLGPRGILFLGTAETPGEYAEYFDTLDSKWKIYGKRGSADMRIPLPPHAGWRETGAPAAARGADLFAGAASEKALLQALGPSVLVDASLRVAHVHGETSRFLELAQGEPNMSVVDLVRPELRGEVSAALVEAGTQRKSITRDGIRMKREGATFLASVTVKPIVGMPERPGFAAVSFSETVDVPPARKGAGEKGRGESRIRQLEGELQYTRENLRSTIEELETANEELRSANEEYQSTNEELQSSNEELETSREELQSVNEELLTVNNEYQNKIDELSVINDDMMNLLNSSNMATIFLDNALQIKRYTPDATRIFNLIGTDVGRPLGHLTSNLQVEGLVEHARTVLDSLIPYRQEVQTRDGHWYSMRLHPYRTTADAIAGVVLSFVDINDYISDKVVMLGRLKVADEFSLLLASHEETPVIVLDADLRVVAANDAFRRLGTAAPLVGQWIYEAQGGAWNTADIHALLEVEMPREPSVNNRRLQMELPGLGRRWARVDGHDVRADDGQTIFRYLALTLEPPST